MLGLACSHAPEVVPAPETQVYQPLLRAIPQSDGILLRWGWYTWDSTTYPPRVNPEAFEVLAGIAEPLQVVAQVPGDSTSLMLRGIDRERPYLFAVRGIAAGSKPSLSTPVMAQQGLLRTLHELMPGDPVHRFHATWSPDGRSVVYEREDAAGRDIYRYDLAGGAEYLLVPRGRRPVWGPERDRVAFVYTSDSSQTGVPNNSLAVHSEQGIEGVYQDNASQQWLAWHPGGAALLTLADREQAGAYSLWTVSLPDPTPRLLLSPPALPELETPEARSVHRPVWDPTGTQIAYARFVQKGEAWARDIFVYAPGGSETPLIVSAWNDHSPAWSPTGEQVAFFSDRSGRMAVWLYDLANGRLQQLCAGDQPRIDSERSRLTWDADGERLLFTALSADGYARFCYIEL
ncbi:MAG: hypothetical protein OHK0039_09340 [Bacteroidia bacterium]